MERERVERINVVREGYREVLSEFYDRLSAELAEKNGSNEYTKFEALMPPLINFLLPPEDKRCRIVLEYDPAKRMVECYHLSGEELQLPDRATVRD